MFVRSLTSALMAALMIYGSASAEEEKAAPVSPHFQKGEELLKKGKLDDAIASYLEAARAEPDRVEYATKARLIRRVQSLRESLEKTEVSPQWERTAISLHVFYLQNEVLGEALALDRKVHEKLKSATSASMLAETLLELDRSAEAVELLRGLDEKQLDLQNRLYLAIAQARVGNREEASKIVAELREIEDRIGLGLLYDSARLHALLGKKEECCGLLTRLLEQAPPPQVPAVRTYVKECRDFRTLLADASFQKALATESKQPYSACSTGASCATCPSGASCGAAGASCQSPSECVTPPRTPAPAP